jgi:type I restriction enzyme S subunit
VKTRIVQVGELASKEPGAFKIGPFGSSLKKTELVSSGIPVVGIENVLPNSFVKDFRRFITSAKFAELSDYEILPHDVLVTTMGTIGRAASAPSDLGRAIFDSHLFRMRVDRGRVFPPYLCYGLNSNSVASQLARMARGAIMDGLNTTILRECVLPLPEVPEQQRIVRQLEKADRLRQARRFSLELTDTLLPAVFLQLFGDPHRNPKRWDTGTIDDVVLSSQYGTSKKANSARQGYPVLGMGNITNTGSLDLSTLAYVDLQKDEFEALALQRGDIIFNRTNSTELVGKTAHWNLEMAAVVASYLVRLRMKPEVLPSFFAALLNTRYFKNLFRDRCKKAVGQSNISPTLLKEFPSYVPPLPLQQKFDTFLNRAERLRSVQREELRQADHLFASLLHRAFCG